MKTKTLRILVTAVGGDLAQSVIKCVRDSGYNTYIVGLDMNPHASGRNDVELFLQAPPVKEEQNYTDFILKTVETEKIHYIFPLSDIEILFFNRSKLAEKTPAKIIISEPHIIDTFMDKYLTAAFFKENGIPYPRTCLPSEYDNRWEFPLILKKRRGSGSQGLFKVNDPAELDFYLERHNDMIIQEYLPSENNEYTSGLFSDGKTKHTITFKRELAPGGYSRQVYRVTDEPIVELPRKIAETLEFKGSVNVQFRRTERGCVPFEINPRFSSTVYFRHLFGFRDVQWVLDMAESEKTGEWRPIVYSPIAKNGTGVRKLSEVIFWDEE